MNNRIFSSICPAPTIKPGTANFVAHWPPTATLLAALLALIYALFPCPVSAAESANEQQLIQILQSDRSLGEKDAACARLKRIGTAASVPALGSLLTDEQLSHSALHALEVMDNPQASQALIDALAKTHGLTKVGIIDSLAIRRDKNAVPALAKLLTESEATVAVSAANALGRISGAEAMRLLRAALDKSTGPVHEAIVDGTLQCANRLTGTGGQDSALSVFQRLYKTEKAERFQVAAYRGMILCSGPKGLKLITEALTAAPAPAQTAALQLAREIKAPGATKELADLLPRVSVPVRRALIEALAQRGDPAAAQQIAAVIKGGSPEVQIAALNALGDLGDASMVPFLAEAAASRKGDEQAAARLALTQLRHGDVSNALIRELGSAKPGSQAELARALGERRELSAVPRLLELAAADSGSSRKAALQALAVLAGQAQLPAMVGLVLASKDDVSRSQAAEALNSAFQNVHLKAGQVDAAPLIQALTSGTATAEAKIALLPVCSGLGDAQVRSALRNSLADANPQVRVAAVRALCDTRDGNLLPDLLKLACEAPEENLRTLAIAGCVRLISEEESVKLSNSEKLGAMKAILATQPKPEQKRLILAGLAAVPETESLNIAQALLPDSAVRAEASRAVVRLGATVPDSKMAAAALKAVLADNPSPTLRSEAEAALKQIRGRAAFVTAWQYTGPYRQEGKDFAALFDVAFPPEKQDATEVKWKNLPVCSDPQKPYSMDLLQALGGEQCVAYARTWVRSETEQKAVLELGTDDGVKVWVNDKLVHANNVARPLQPGSDKAPVTLRAGWNSILLKVTQNNLGWEFCAKFLSPDGAPAEGLEIKAEKAP